MPFKFSWDSIHEAPVKPLWRRHFDDMPTIRPSDDIPEPPLRAMSTIRFPGIAPQEVAKFD
jgi:hypothetical protein